MLAKNISDATVGEKLEKKDILALHIVIKKKIFNLSPYIYDNV